MKQSIKRDPGLLINRYVRGRDREPRVWHRRWRYGRQCDLRCRHRGEQHRQVPASWYQALSPANRSGCVRRYLRHRAHCRRSRHVRAYQVPQGQYFRCYNRSSRRSDLFVWLHRRSGSASSQNRGRRWDMVEWRKSSCSCRIVMAAPAQLLTLLLPPLPRNVGKPPK